jgi:environmental stress-induced protein Ves
MTLRVVRLSESTPQPWRNGGGVTRELLAWRVPGGERDNHIPAAGHSDDWSLRVSVADITQEGPFSAFPGIDRCFTVLEGAGVELMLPDRSICLGPGDAPLWFDGAAAPGCRLLAGPTRDLNLMVRTAAGRAGMARAEAGVPWVAGALWRALYVHGPAVVELGHATQAVDEAGLLWSAAPATPDAPAALAEGAQDSAQAAHTASWRLIEGGPAWWLWMDPPKDTT